MGTHTVDQQHTVYPEMNLYRPSNVSGNATYNCSIATPGGPILTWEVGGQQIITDEQFMDFADRGIYIDPWPANNTVIVTTLVVSEQARQSYKNLSVQCVARQSLQSIKVPRERAYYIISYDPPSAIIMDKLQLVPMDEDLILRWDRPSNVLIEVAVDYTIIINSTNDSTAIYNQIFTTNETSVSLQFLQAQILNDNAGDDCITFELSVSAGNDAGSAELTTIMDSIPLSIDIRDVSDTLKVERVNLYPLLVEISYLPVMPCNIRYPLSNYSIKVDNVSARVIHTFDDSMKPFEKDGRIHLELNETTLPGVTLDGSFNLTVTACNDITCRESDNITFNTTDVQDVKLTFYKNHLFLRCIFTDDSKAQGCALNLTLFGNNETETHKIYREDGDTRCFDVNNQLEAYRDIVVFDIEEDGTSGNIGLPIELDEHVNVSTANNFTQMTGCRILSDGDSNVAVIILGSVLFIIVALAMACILILIIVAVVYKRNKNNIVSSVNETDSSFELTFIQEMMISPSKQGSIRGEAFPPKHPASPPKEKQQEREKVGNIHEVELTEQTRTTTNYPSVNLENDSEMLQAQATEEVDSPDLQAPSEHSDVQNGTDNEQESDSAIINTNKTKPGSGTVEADGNSSQNVTQAEEMILKECGIEFCLPSDIHDEITISIDLQQLSRRFSQVQVTKGLKLKIIKLSAQTDA